MIRTFPSLSIPSQQLLTLTSAMQGRETLINRFRNSSVMKENVDSRPRVRLTPWGLEALTDCAPKLYMMLPDPRAGEEEAFPIPDNLYKLARSTQNAATIGMYSFLLFNDNKRRR